MPADHSLQYFRMSADSNHFRFLFLLLAMLMLSSCAYTRLNQVMREVGREYEGFACAALVEKTNQPVCFMEPLKEGECAARVFYVAMRKVRYRHKESWIGLMGRGGTTDFEILGETDDKTRYYRKYDNRTQEVKWLTSLPTTAVPNPVSEANWRERTEIQVCTARHKEPVTVLTYPASIALIAVDIPASVVTSVASGTWATLYLTWLLITGDTNILI